MNAVGVIPARLASKRLPRKLLLTETGKPLLQYAWESACRAQSLSQVFIATDSEEIATVARGFGAEVVLTEDHPSGTDRIAEVIRKHCPDAELVVNVQGDEPELEPAVIDRLVAVMTQRPQVEMGTLACPIHSVAVLEDRGCVKVVTAANGKALYFSRLPIPCFRDGEPGDLLATKSSSRTQDALDMLGTESSDATPADGPLISSPWLLHLGIYAYRPEFLLALTQMPPSRLEQLESLEQLRALEAGASIHVEIVPHRSVGIDTSGDYAGFVARERRRQSSQK
ncbi:MAG: 3-deoxy-manno-octulosonate cytidylyltransferase [Planctomycetaceae bacterium]|nr:3-deoxy-manno-octulosonate cytidylyltransferase [Planctomycetaceae bacterium]